MSPMESLAEQLAAQLEKSRARRTDEENRLVDDAIRELSQSGIAARSLGPGDRAPDFALPNQLGEVVAEADARARGPYVLSFYRGAW